MKQSHINSWCDFEGYKENKNPNFVFSYIIQDVQMENMLQNYKLLVWCRCAYNYAHIHI